MVKSSDSHTEHTCNDSQSHYTQVQNNKVDNERLDSDLGMQPEPVAEELSERKMSGVDILPTITEGVVLESPSEVPDRSFNNTVTVRCTDTNVVQMQCIGNNTFEKLHDSGGDFGNTCEMDKNCVPSTDESCTTVPQNVGQSAGDKGESTSETPVSNALSIICEMYSSSESSESRISPPENTPGLQAITQAYKYSVSTALEPQVVIKNSISKIDTAFKSAQANLLALELASTNTRLIASEVRSKAQEGNFAGTGNSCGNQSPKAYSSNASVEEAYWIDAKVNDPYVVVPRRSCDNDQEGKPSTIDFEEHCVDINQLPANHVVPTSNDAVPQRQRKPNIKVQVSPVIELTYSYVYA